MSRNISFAIVLVTLAAIFSIPLIEFSPANEGVKKEEAIAKEKKPVDDEEYYELFKTLADTIDQVERNYVKDISRRELMEAAIEGILKKLDPHSSYISPKEIDRFTTSVESQFGGIGNSSFKRVRTI